ncbi:MAG: molybdenum cofactor guanylyltransferase MobA [Pseudomonadota bacterium]
MTLPHGIILAGGRATRMGGGDKGLLQIAGQSILSRVIARIDDELADLAINANGDPTRFASFGLPVVADSVEGFAGPLAGILAGLDWGRAVGASHVVTVAADTPFFPQDLVARLLDAGTDHAIVLAETPSGCHPTFGLWRTSLADDLREALANGTRKVVAFTNAHDCAYAAFDDERAFFNVNTPVDLATAEGMVT